MLEFYNSINSFIIDLFFGSSNIDYIERIKEYIYNEQDSNGVDRVIIDDMKTLLIKTDDDGNPIRFTIDGGNTYLNIYDGNIAGHFIQYLISEHDIFSQTEYLMDGYYGYNYLLSQDYDEQYNIKMNKHIFKDNILLILLLLSIFPSYLFYNQIKGKISSNYIFN